MCAQADGLVYVETIAGELRGVDVEDKTQRDKKLTPCQQLSGNGEIS